MKMNANEVSLMRTALCNNSFVTDHSVDIDNTEILYIEEIWNKLLFARMTYFAR